MEQEQNYTPQATNRDPQANVPSFAKQGFQAIAENKNLRSLEDILASTGNVMINNIEIGQPTIEAARRGDESARNLILMNLESERIGQDIVLGGGKPIPVMGTTKAVEEIKKAVKSGDAFISSEYRGIFEHLQPWQQEDLVDFQLNRTRLFDTIDNKLWDNRTKALLVDHFTTGDFFEETGRQLKEFGRFTQNVPSYADAARRIMMGYLSSGLGFEGTDERKQRVKRELAQQFANDYKLFDPILSSTYGINLNDFLKKKFIEKYGQERYDKDYVVVVNGQRVEERLISDELATELLDLGFNELPARENFLSYFVQNVIPTGTMAIFNRISGSSKLRKVDRAIKNDSTGRFKGKSPESIYRTLMREERTDKFHESYANFMDRVAKRFYEKGGNLQTATITREIKQTKIELNEEIKQVKEELRNGKGVLLSKDKKVKDYTTQDKVLLNARLDSLRARRNRISFQFGGEVYPFSLAVDEGLIAAGQSAGYIFSGALDPEVGGLIGAMTMAVAGKPITRFGVQAAKGVGLIPSAIFGAENINTIVTDSLRVIDDTASALSGGALRGLFVGNKINKFKEIETILDRKLTAREVDGFSAISDLLTNLPENLRGNLHDNMIKYTQKRNAFLKIFDEGEERQEIDLLLTESFATMSGVSALQGLVHQAMQKGNKGFAEATALQQQRDNNLIVFERAYEKIKLKLNEKLGIDKTSDSLIEKFKGDMEKTINAFNKTIQDNRSDQLNQLREFEFQIENGIVDIGVYDNLVENLVNAEVLLNPQKFKDMVKIIEEKSAIYQNGIIKRIEELEDTKGTIDQKKTLATLTENVYTLHEDAKYIKAKSLYKVAEETMGEEVVDFSPVIEALVNKRKGVKADVLKAVFGRDGELYRSLSGKRAMRAFNTLVVDSLKRQGFDGEDLLNLKALYSSPKVVKDGEEIANPKYIGNDPDMLEIGLAMYLDKESNFSPFVGGVFEIDELRKSFRNIANILNKNEATAMRAGEYQTVANDVDAILMKSKAGPALEQARTNYQKVIFDPTRPESFGEKITNSITGPKFAAGPIDGLMFPYKLDMTPDKWHRNIGELVDKAANNSKYISDLDTAFNSVVLYWADDVVAGKPVFDLTTEAGMRKFKLVQVLLGSSIREHWAPLKQIQLQKHLLNVKKLRPEEVSSIEFPKDVQINIINELPRADYNMSKFKNLEEIDKNLFSVSIIRNKDEKLLEETKLISVQDLLADETDIFNIMKSSEVLQTDYKKFQVDVENGISSMKNNVDSIANKLSRFQDILKDAYNVRNDKEFFESFVINGSKEKLDILKSAYINNRARMLQSDKGMEKISTPKFLKGKIDDLEYKELEKEFHSLTTIFTFNGLHKYTGMRVSSSPLFTTATHGPNSKKYVKILDNPEVILDILQDPTEGKREIILELLGGDESILKNIEDFSEQVFIARGAEQVKFIPSGNIRPISYNEIISRAFNIARGMVSPQYVAAEFAFRLMQVNKMSMLTLAAENPDVGTLLTKLVKDRESITKQDIKTITEKTISFFIREAAYSNRGLDTIVPDFVSGDEVDAARLEIEMEEAQQID